MVSNKSKTSIEAVRHSLAHLLALSALTIDPKAKFGVGPVIENGFYYDIQFSRSLDSEALLKRLEQLMREFIKQDLKFEAQQVSLAKAKKVFSGADRSSTVKIRQPFKLELLNDIQKYGTTEWSVIQKLKARKVASSSRDKRRRISPAGSPATSTKVTLYRVGDFLDLCRGGHIRRTSEIPPYFTLTQVGGAYWRGDEKKPMLTRIYGVAFEKKKELDEFLKQQEIIKRYNHRVLGEQLGIFLISDKVGKGLPILLPKGEAIKHELQEYMREKELRYGYQYVAAPVIASSRLYEASGHKKYFGEEMYEFVDPDNEEFFIKPMNCPHHHMVYQKLVQSYRDLPLRLAESGAVYRFERSGAVYGLMRLRGPITQNDAHLYIDEDDLESEFKNVLRLLQEVYREIRVIKNYWFRLSLPDFKGKNKEKFGGDLKLWQWASKVIEAVCRKEKLKFVEGVGEAAFYGPKLDMQVQNIFGKEETIATIQVDILMSRRMGLTYKDRQGEEKYPIIIHRAILGAYERFIAFLLEATHGDLPLWLAPVQVSILPISEKHLNRAEEIKNMFLEKKIRVEISEPTETVSKRILLAEKEKIPYIAVVGDKEMLENTVSVRQRHSQDLGKLKVGNFIERLLEKIKEKK